MNVILHGLFTYLDRDTGLEILIPDMGTSHVYRAGEFLGETTLPQYPLRLQNVRGGSRHFDPRVNLVTNGVQPVRQPRIFSSLQFPTPVEIFSLRPLDLSDVLQDPAQALSSKTVSIVQVLTYRFDDFDRIKLGNDPIEVDPLQAPDGSFFVNLHVWAEEDAEQGVAHAVKGFDAVMGLLDFKQQRPRLTRDKDSMPMTQDKLPPGTTMMEFLDLPVRTKNLAILGRDLRQAALAGGQHLVEGLGTGTKPSTCTPGISRLH